jgi:hypothetical protein
MLGLVFRDKAMFKSDTLRHGAPGETAVHLCVDMQRMFTEGTEWKMPWLERVLPNILSITSTHPEKTIFNRSSPPRGRVRVWGCGVAIMSVGDR